MKRHTFLLLLFVVFVTATIAQAQTQTATPAGQRQGGQRQALQQAAEELSVRRVQIVEQVPTVSTAWWTNTGLVTRLGLTDVQKVKIESTFESHRQNLMSNRQLLEKEEGQLARLLEAESVDRGAVFTQINRVIQARGEMERTNATMSLEMREQLTRAQWAQLQAAQPRVSWSVSREAVGGYQLHLRTNPGEEQPGGRGQRGVNPGQQ